MSETSYKSFNDLLSEFIAALSNTFEEYTELSDANSNLSALLAIDPTMQMPMDKFYEVFSEHAGAIMQKQDSLFDVCRIPYADGFDISKEYKESDPETQKAIWDYLQQLFAMATTVKMLPPDMMSQIEAVANSCMESVTSGEVSQEQAQSPAYILQMLNSNPELMSSLKKQAESIEKSN